MIPKLHYISQGNSPKEHLENIQNACTSGIELVQLYIHMTSEKKFLKLANEVRDITSHFQTRLIINGNYKVAKTVKADGVHLEQTDVCPTIVRKHLHTWQIIGGTTHTIQECDSLIVKEVDYIGLAPFKEIASTEASALGLHGFSEITQTLNTETPILGYGGIIAEDVSGILKTGISGVMISEDITRDFNRIKTYHDLLNASSTSEQRYDFK